jgi:Glycosyltransferase family 87
VARTRQSSKRMKSPSWILVLCLGLIVIGYAALRPLPDFVEYWASAHQLVAGKNPYSLPEILNLERPLGCSRPVPLMNLTPPWTLPLIAPLGLTKSYSVAWIVWTSTLAFILWSSTRLLLDLYSGGVRVFPSESYAGEAILGFTFFPSLGCLALAQITPFALMGIAGFLWFEERKRYALGGICLALATIKPHLVYLVLLGVLFSSWQKRKSALLFSMASVLSFFGAVAMLMRPSVLADYWALSRSGYMRIFPAALGAMMRYPFQSRDMFPLQFVPAVFGTIWFLFYWSKHRHGWDWKVQMPVLVTASVLTTAYGWTFDQVLLVIPIVAVAARYVAAQGRLPKRIVVVYTALNIALILGLLFWRLAFVLAPLTFAVVLFTQAQSGGKIRLAQSSGGSELA